MGNDAALHSDLADAVVGADGAHQRLAVLRIVDHRLFDVDVLARLAGVDTDRPVPVVGSGDDDGVDVLVAEHAFVFLVGLDGAAGDGGRFIDAHGVDVADGGPLNLAGLVQLLHEVLAPRAGSDGAHPDTVISANDAPGAGGGDGGRGEELPS